MFSAVVLIAEGALEGEGDIFIAVLALHCLLSFLMLAKPFHGLVI